MKFKAQPGLFVRICNKYVQRVTGKKGFYFNNKGEYETDQELIIKLIGDTFEKVENNAVEEVKSEEIKKKHCKKCEFACETQGELLQHYKHIHPKEG